MVTYEQLVAEISELRLKRDQAEAVMLCRLVAIERDNMETILAAGHNSFDSFVEQFIKPGKFEAFKRGLDKVDIATAQRIGSDATIVAGRLSNGPDEYVEAVVAWRGEHNGMFPTQQTCRNILRDVDPQRQVPGPVRRLELVAQLRAEIESLRAENRELKRRIAKLEGKRKSSGKRVKDQAQA